SYSSHVDTSDQCPARTPSIRAASYPFRPLPQSGPQRTFFFHGYAHPRALHSFPTRRSSDLGQRRGDLPALLHERAAAHRVAGLRSEEHTSELQSRVDLVCRLLLEKKK